MWYTHPMECYLIIKIAKILTHATAWMSLRIIMLSERSQKKNPTWFADIAAQFQKNKPPNQKMGQRTKHTFLQRRHTDG